MLRALQFKEGDTNEAVTEQGAQNSLLGCQAPCNLKKETLVEYTVEWGDQKFV